MRNEGRLKQRNNRDRYVFFDGFGAFISCCLLNYERKESYHSHDHFSLRSDHNERFYNFFEGCDTET